MKTRSSQLCNRCTSTELGTQIPVCFSSILLDSKNSQQNTQGKSSKTDNKITPARATKVLYPKILNMPIKSPISKSWRKNLFRLEYPNSDRIYQKGMVKKSRAL